MTNEQLSNLLLTWYANNGRDLPWRVKGGAHPDPYVILVSEFMLQQTGVKAVIPYFERFMKRFPTVQSLANASQEDVYLYWQGLGYYTRAHSLHTTAQIICNEYGGQFPQSRTDVLKLKGIGNYTAASFLSLAFNQPETVIDGNVIRVICRLYHLTQPTSEIMDEIRQKAEMLTDHQHPADYASAIMDLGAMICPPKKPQCLLCPWQKSCLSKGSPDLEQIPKRSKPDKRIKNGSVYLITNQTGEIFIRKREEKGLLSGLYEFPWSKTGELFDNLVPFDTGMEITHIFTNFKLSLKIYTIKTELAPIRGCFISPQNLKDYPISTLMTKVYNYFQDHK